MQGLYSLISGSKTKCTESQRYNLLSIRSLTILKAQVSVFPAYKREHNNPGRQRNGGTIVREGSGNGAGSDMRGDREEGQKD